jgi:hypothetical protein
MFWLRFEKDSNWFTVLELKDAFLSIPCIWIPSNPLPLNENTPSQEKNNYLRAPSCHRDLRIALILLEHWQKHLSDIHINEEGSPSMWMIFSFSAFSLVVPTQC